MRDLIPSRDVAKYLQSRAHQFTDSEQATLIYNADWSIREKHAALMELADRTSDEKPADQINERIARDGEGIERGVITKECLPAKPSSVLQNARNKYVTCNPLPMLEIDEEIQSYRKEKSSRTG